MLIRLDIYIVTSIPNLILPTNSPINQGSFMQMKNETVMTQTMHVLFTDPELIYDKVKLYEGITGCYRCFSKSFSLKQFNPKLSGRYAFQ